MATVLAEDFAPARVRPAPRAAADCWRQATKTAPATSTTAKPARMGQRYFCRGSGASMGGPSPPPGRLPAGAAADTPCAPPSCCSASEPSPETLKARFCPALVPEATCVIESGWLGLFIDW